jgi:hypothetical protein
MVASHYSNQSPSKMRLQHSHSVKTKNERSSPKIRRLGVMERATSLNLANNPTNVGRYKEVPGEI